MGFLMRHWLHCIVLLSVNAFTVASFVSSLQSSCLDHERSALLQFKQSFHKDCTYVEDSSPKMESWVGEANANCCSWDGIECDLTTGHVIGLYLDSSCISGTFPPNSTLFRLSHLQKLDLSYNDFKLSRIPSEISILRSLKSLKLTGSSFCCQIPSGISKLSNLSILDISFNYMSGPIPSSFSNLTMLTDLFLDAIDMTGNFLPGKFSSWLPKLHNNLESLVLSYLNLPSDMPHLLANFTNLRHLVLSDTQLTGPLPQEFANLTQLQYLDLDENNLEGPIPQWLSHLTNLQFLDLSYNNLLSGNFHIFSNLKQLRSLDLSEVKLTFSPTYSNRNTSLFKLHHLYLSSCNLTEFPQYLRDQDELQSLDLSFNNIKGNIPQWFSDITNESLLGLYLSKNFLKGFEQPLAVLPWSNLRTLALDDNKFQGELPSLPNSLKSCNLSNNLFSGLNPTSLCNARSLLYLDLSFNNISGGISNCNGHHFVESLQLLYIRNNSLSGVIPEKLCNARLITLELSSNKMSGQLPSCIGNQLGKSLQFLNLQDNSFHGTIPSTFTRLCKLKILKLSQNKLEGQLPRSLANCTMLEMLDIGSNHVNDTFPSWLGSLPSLRVLLLDHNNFHGSIGDPRSDLDLNFLSIINLSHNQLSGNLPSRYIQQMHAMRDPNENTSALYNITYDTETNSIIDLYSITITNKGSDLPYPKIPEDLRVVDFSSNNFIGRIPTIIGDLKGLQVLNLSNNTLEGEIPSSLANIIHLESLDLSLNKLCGPIPQGLSQLTSLEVFNISYNLLTGSLPQGPQSFDNTSFMGNPGLCGSPLSKKCENADPSTPVSPVPSNDEGSKETEFIDWVIRSLGCLSGCIIGFVIGKLFITDKYHEWFLETFGRQRLHRRGQRAPRQRF